MPKALVLYTNGTFEEVALKGFEEYQEIVDGSIQIMPLYRSYLNPNTKKRSNLTVYVNEEGLLKQLPQNPWSMLISVFGIHVEWMYGGVYGNIIVFNTSSDNEDANIDPYIIDMAKEFLRCDNNEDGDDLDQLLTRIEKEQSIKTKENTIKKGKEKIHQKDVILDNMAYHMKSKPKKAKNPKK